MARSLLCGVVAAGAAGSPLQAEWQPLFNGHDLSGWTKLGGAAEYRVEGDSILGLSRPSSQNTFLVAEGTYSDFVLELEFKVDTMNSGVQVRSNSDPEYRGGVVHGYQIEIDPSERAWTAGVYDESRRGWLFPMTVNPEAQRAFEKGAWNQLRIDFRDDVLRTWLNGVPATYLVDDSTRAGFIALQVHAPYPNVAREGDEVRWRNIRIQTDHFDSPGREDFPFVIDTRANRLGEREQALGWRSLFDGETTHGWRPVHGRAGESLGGRWSVVDGALMVGGPSTQPEGRSYEGGLDIVTLDEFAAFELQIEFRFAEGANSGIKYGVTEQYHPDSKHGVGFEFQILDDQRHPDARVERGALRRLGALYDLIEADKQDRFVKGPGGWNHARIVMKPNGTVEHWLNHQLVLSFDRHSPEFQERVASSKFKGYEGFGSWPRGRILLQDHGDQVEFRSLKVRSLDEPP